MLAGHRKATHADEALCRSKAAHTGAVSYVDERQPNVSEAPNTEEASSAGRTSWSSMQRLMVTVCDKIRFQMHIESCLDYTDLICSNLFSYCCI